MPLWIVVVYFHQGIFNPSHARAALGQKNELKFAAVAKVQIYVMLRANAFACTIAYLRGYHTRSRNHVVYGFVVSNPDQTSFARGKPYNMRHASTRGSKSKKDGFFETEWGPRRYRRACEGEP